MTSYTVFTSNRSQAVRLPKAVAFPEDVHRVDILKIGRSRVIVPQGKRWDDLFQNGPRASEDFMVGIGPAAERFSTSVHGIRIWRTRVPPHPTALRLGNSR